MLAQKKDHSLDRGEGKTLAQIEEAVSVFRGYFKDAITESGLKHEYVAHCLRVTPSYLSKLYATGVEQKPIQVRHVMALPSPAYGLFVERLAIACDRLNTVTVTVRSGADRYVMGMALAAAFGGDPMTAKVIGE